MNDKKPRLVIKTREELLAEKTALGPRPSYNSPSYFFWLQRMREIDFLLGEENE